MESLYQQAATALVDVLRLVVWLVLLMVIFIPLERFFAVRPQKIFRKAFGSDVFYYFLSSLLPKMLLVLPMSGLAWVIHRVAPAGFYLWTARLPLSIRFAASLVVGEIGAYWGHRWSHQFPFLWRFHALHHSAEEVDWLVHTRAHPVDMVFTRLCGYVPMYLLGLAQPAAAGVDIVPYLVTIAGTVWGFFIHSNVRWRLGWLEFVISSPAFHHWHHTNDGPEYVDKNFASMLPWVDKMFGTFYLPNRQWPTKYGTDSNIPPRVVGQLVEPLERILS